MTDKEIREILNNHHIYEGLEGCDGMTLGDVLTDHDIDSLAQALLDLFTDPCPANPPETLCPTTRPKPK